LEKNMTIKANIKILESNNTISQRISRALVPQINEYLKNIYKNIEKSIPDIVINSIMSQPEYSSLMSGSLRGEFGIPDPAARLSQILETIKSGSNIVRKATSVVNSKISAGIEFRMVKSDFQDILSLGASSFTTEKGSKLEWLRWLLLEGDSVIIIDYAFIPGASEYSRTGLGIMKPYGGSFWRVPPEFAGTIKDNWITRGIAEAAPIIQRTLEQLLKS
jgi:hypothetical protein